MYLFQLPKSSGPEGMLPAFWHPPFLPAGDSHPGSPYLPRDPVHIRRLRLLAPSRKVCLVGLMLGLPVSSSARTCPYWCYSATHSWGPRAPLGRAALAAESMLMMPCNWLENPPNRAGIHLAFLYWNFKNVFICGCAGTSLPCSGFLRLRLLLQSPALEPRLCGCRAWA